MLVWFPVMICVNYPALIPISIADKLEGDLIA